MYLCIFLFVGIWVYFAVGAAFLHKKGERGAELVIHKYVCAVPAAITVLPPVLPLRVDIRHRIQRSAFCALVCVCVCDVGGGVWGGAPHHIFWTFSSQFSSVQFKFQPRVRATQ